MWYRPQYNKWRYEKDADTNLYPPDAIQTVYQRGLSEGRKAGLMEAAKISREAEYDCCGLCAKDIEAALKEGE